MKASPGFRCVLFLALILCLTTCFTAHAAVVIVPDSGQAALAMKIINDYHDPRPANPPEKLRLIYFTPSDRDPVPDYEHRLEAILADIQTFYGEGMRRHGFGAKTFELERDAKGKFIVHLVKGKKTRNYYVQTWKNHGRILGGECQTALAADGLSLSNETVAVVCNLADWNEKTGKFTHPTPYTGTWTQQGGLCWVMDSPILNSDYQDKKEPIVDDFQFGKVPMGRRNSMFIGGFAHELGHAFGLPHSGRRWDEVESEGASIMGAGNLVYHEERRHEGRGAALTMASAMRLAARPLFNASDKGIMEKPNLDQCDLKFSTKVTRADLAGRKAAIRIEGTVRGSPPIYAVIAYFNSARDGGYRSPAETAVPDAEGRFAMELSDLARCNNGQLTVAICHVNSAVSERQFPFTVNDKDIVNVKQ
jgi:hypothetical protein